MKTSRAPLGGGIKMWLFGLSLFGRSIATHSPSQERLVLFDAPHSFKVGGVRAARSMTFLHFLHVTNRAISTKAPSWTSAPDKSMAVRSPCIFAFLIAFFWVRLKIQLKVTLSPCCMWLIRQSLFKALRDSARLRCRDHLTDEVIGLELRQRHLYFQWEVTGSGRIPH